ncbi:MAG: tRNA (adenine(58)-N(1))-methyltransferase non-catalytic subunit trm6 [Piccolia ochrophora]|nr:MAG: tRNA (adenine(58)-N(1))-methyltransferase non-catalytic subunit trm6 [Piccolia ochrophora]
MHSVIQPGTCVALRLPSSTLKIVTILPNTTVSIGKYGSFSANYLLGRPYNLTFEILDKIEGEKQQGLRVVSALEIHADTLAENESPPSELNDTKVIDGGGGVEYELVGEDGEVIVRTNRDTIDDPGRQSMTMDEIEALKKEGTSSGKDLIARLMLSHSGLGQKTSFSLAKYTLRKTKKYLRRFTVLPLDVPVLLHWLVSEKDPSKIMELRDETLALVASMANVHHGGAQLVFGDQDDIEKTGHGRWLMVDETGGMYVAAMAERMGILHPSEEDEDDSTLSPPTNQALQTTSNPLGRIEDDEDQLGKGQTYAPHKDRPPAMSARSNYITLLHANAQPNLSLLKYFMFDSSNPSAKHPLYTHLKTVSWLQLLSPEEDPGYAEPESVPDEEFRSWKSGKRGTYYRKRRRWERTTRVVNETRAGGFDGLIVASAMNPTTILQHAVPLLRGSAQVVVYSPYIEPLAELADLYSTPRRAAFATNPPEPESLPSEDFPLNPTLLLAPTVQTIKLRNWQCLPGRTHPMMTGRGGGEGYIFTATRVIPLEGKVEARGKFKRRKVVQETTEVEENDGMDGQAPEEVDPKPEILDECLNETHELVGNGSADA